MLPRALVNFMQLHKFPPSPPYHTSLCLKLKRDRPARIDYWYHRKVLGLVINRYMV
jgi:hypothetical protein